MNTHLSTRSMDRNALNFIQDTVQKTVTILFALIDSYSLCCSSVM